MLLSPHLVTDGEATRLATGAVSKTVRGASLWGFNSLPLRQRHFSPIPFPTTSTLSPGAKHHEASEVLVPQTPSGALLPDMVCFNEPRGRGVGVQPMRQPLRNHVGLCRHHLVAVR